MRNLRYTIELGEGVKAELLFAPHLYSFKGVCGACFDIKADTQVAVMEAYADILYCAALNAWVLDGHGSEEDAPFRRGDFHALMIGDPRGFGRAMNFAYEALTGKRLKDALTDKEVGDDSKKKASGWIGRLLKRSS